MLSRASVIQELLSLYESPSYLEIGVFSGATFFEVNAARKVGVDPNFQFDTEAKRESNAEFYEIPSDEYFGSAINRGEIFDVVYLDGLHTHEQTLRDFVNSIAYLKPDGVLLIDDILPRTYQGSLRTMDAAFKVGDFLGNGDRAWMGDTYKLAFFIDTFFQQFNFRTVEDNEGQLVVWRERRHSVHERSVESIARMQFDDLVFNYHVLNRKPLSAIMSELKKWKSSL